MTLGQSLVNARKSAGFSLDDLAAKTNIRANLLKEFEADDFHNAGGDTYARGHLKTIAKICNVDAEILLMQFDDEHAHAKRAIHEQLVENSATFAIPEKSKLTQKQLIIFSVIGIVGLLLVSVVVSGLKQSASNPKPKPAASASASPSKSAEPSAKPSATANSYSSGSGVMVKLEAVKGSSWLYVSDAAGVTLYSGRASQGQVFEFSSTETVNLRVGNAGAVKLTVNGKEVPPLGGDGEVVNVSYGVNS